MGKIAVVQIINKNDWEEFLLRNEEANFLQSWYWGEFHESLGKKIYRSGFYEDNLLIGVMLSVIEPAKRGKYLTVPGGPIINWNKKNIESCFVEEVRRIAKHEKCIFVRVRPQLLETEDSLHKFGKLGFVHAPTHLHAQLTSQLDITKSEEELLINMRKATRYEVKKAEKIGVRVTSSTDTNLLKEFFDLQIETSKRQGFVPFSYNFLKNQFEIFARNNLALLYRAEFEKKVLAEAFIIFYNNEAVYHYGASTDEGRKYPGAYLIQWEAIKEAKRRNIKRYNFWGVSPVGNENHRFAGLSLFKRGFGGEDVNYLRAHDLIINKPRYLLNSMIETMREKMRRLK